MSCRSTMFRRLSGLGLYQFVNWNGMGTAPENMPLVQCELEAYLSGLELIEKGIDSMLVSSFPQLADAESITRFERLLAIPVKQNVSLAVRRQMVVDKLSIHPSDFNLNGMYRALRSAGIDTTITQFPSQGKILINLNNILASFFSLDEIKSAIEALVPAHLYFDVETGASSWAELDLKNYTWSKLDSLDKTWEDIETGA